MNIPFTTVKRPFTVVKQCFIVVNGDFGTTAIHLRNLGIQQCRAFVVALWDILERSVPNGARLETETSGAVLFSVSDAEDLAQRGEMTDTIHLSFV